MNRATQPIEDRLLSASTLPKLNKLLETPWRYRCPDADCRSSNIIVRAKASPYRQQYLEYQEHPEAGTLGNDPSPPIADLRCQACNATFDEPFDAKAGERVLVSNEHEYIGGTVVENAVTYE